MKGLRVLVIFALSAQAWGWDHSLSYPGGGYWRTLITVRVENVGPNPIAHYPISLVVGPDLPLAGREVKALRIVTDRGEELMYDVITPDGAPRRSGLLQVGDRVSFLTSIPSRTDRRYYLYADNPSAWAPPEFARTSLISGGFEAGDRDPAGWERVDEDSQHRLYWVTEHARSGRRSVKTVVDPGAPPTWVKFHQTGIPAVEGRTYRFRGWVRAEGVTGVAGWFIHVFSEKGDWLVNRVLNAGEGTYDWRPVEWTLTIPQGGRIATVGTVLYGTGTAWFDDVSLDPIDPDPLHLKVTVVGTERVLLTERLSPPPRSAVSGWQERFPLIVHHFPSQPSHTLVFADLRKVLWRFSRLKGPVGLAVLDPEAPPGRQILPHWRIGATMLFEANLPPSSVKRFDLLVSPYRNSEGLADYIALIHSPVNLAPDLHFEGEKGDQPSAWRADALSGLTILPSEGLFGKRSLAMTVSPSLQGNWVGWRTSVPVQPRRLYFYCGFIKAENNPSPVQLHGHWHDADHRLTSDAPFFNTSPSVSGSQGWVQTHTFVESPADARFAELHLTTNTPGTFHYDGVFFGQVVRAFVGDRDLLGTKKPGLGPLSLWVVNSLIKVFPDAPPENTPSSMTLVMARREWEPLQIALRSAKSLKSVRISVTALRSARGDSLPPPQLWRVVTVPVDQPSAYYVSRLPEGYRHRPKGFGFSDGWAGDWPDPLIPFSPFPVSPNRTEAVLILFYTPADAPPGYYNGKLRIDADDHFLEIPLRVQVVSLTLPDESPLKVTFDLRGSIVPHLLADRNLLKKWYRFLTQFRISPGFVFPQPTFHLRDGRIQIDSGDFDEMARFLIEDLKVSVLYTPDFLYSFGWAYTPQPIFGRQPFSQEYVSAYQEALRVFYKHVQGNGWGDKFVYYISDEPHFWHETIKDQMKRLCALAKEAVPGIRIYSSTWHLVPDWLGSLDIWGVGPHGSCPASDIKKIQEEGGEVLFTTDGQICLDTPYLAIERLLPYLCFKYGVNGYEFWGVSWWTYNPWERGWHSYIRQSDEGKNFYWIRYPNGDGYLVYPGDPVGSSDPLPSLRLIQVREGLEDYWILKAVDEGVTDGRFSGMATERAKDVLESARSLVDIPNAGGLRSTQLLPDPDRVLQIRQRALALFGTLQK